MNRQKTNPRYERQKQDRFEPLPLYLPIPEPPRMKAPSAKKVRDEENERGVWVLEI